MSTPFPARCWAEIDLSALEKNVRLIRRQLPASTCYISVVKADGYGLGAKRVVETIRAAGAKIFAVANVAEGAEIREMDRNIPILLLSATVPEEEDSLFEYDLTPTVSCIDEVRRYQDAAERHQTALPVHVKIDTGMGRLGVWYNPADTLLDAISTAPLLKLRGIYSHFASAGEDARFTSLQRQRFLPSLKRLNCRDDSLLVHIDNSSGLSSFSPDGPFNGVRVGLLQWGILPAADATLSGFGVSPAVSFHSRISLVKELPKGAGISYGGTHVLQRGSRVAIVTAGYADGILRACSNRASVLVHGQRCPILGNVTMDNIVIDVTDLPQVACGDRVTLFGRQEGNEITIHEYSSWCGTIPWESLCALSKRVKRVYV